MNWSYKYLPRTPVGSTAMNVNIANGLSIKIIFQNSFQRPCQNFVKKIFGWEWTVCKTRHQTPDTIISQVFECPCTALCPLHSKYRTILTSCCSVWNMNWQWETEWASKWARVSASPPGCSCCPTSAPPSLTEPHKWQLQLSSVTSTPKIDGQAFLMETVTWSDSHGPYFPTQYLWSFILHWDPMDRG